MKKIEHSLPKAHRPTLNFSFIKILTGSDMSRRRLPLMVARAKQAGPTVWLVGCIHGDEVGGTVVIQELFRRIRLQLARGEVWAFPLVNSIGFETTSRQLTFTKEDLNRSFPGDANGSLAERIADLVFSRIIGTRPDLVLDLHNDVRKSIPYVLIDPPTSTPSAVPYATLLEYARTTELPVVQDDVLRRTLTYNLVARGIPALTFELGESHVVNEVNVADGVACIWRILAGLEMVDPRTSTPVTSRGSATDKVYRYSDQPVTSSSGIVRYLVRPGDFVRAGQRVAIIFNAFGRKVETLTVMDAGLVLGHTDTSAAFPGLAIMALGALREDH